MDKFECLRLLFEPFVSCNCAPRLLCRVHFWNHFAWSPVEPKKWAVELGRLWALVMTELRVQQQLWNKQNEVKISVH